MYIAEGSLEYEISMRLKINNYFFAAKKHKLT